jgi:hypothetical protein
MITEFCDSGTINGKDYKGLTSKLADAVEDMDNSMRKFTAEAMCTSKCPCPNPATVTAYSLWTDNWTEELLNNNNRTKLYASGYTSLNYTTSGYYERFYECFAHLKDINYESVNGYDISEFSDNLITVIENLETEFACSGICDTGAFFYFKKLTDGPPT